VTQIPDGSRPQPFDSITGVATRNRTANRKKPRGNLMANPQEFLESWVSESVQATSYRNRAEARRIAYECRKAAERADISWFGVIMAAVGDVQGYILTKLESGN
jgi:hypothetical protein